MMYGNSSISYGYSPIAEMTKLTIPISAPSSSVQAVADRVATTTPPILIPILNPLLLDGMMVQVDTMKNN